MFKRIFLRLFFSVSAMLGLVSCSASNHFAPVNNGWHSSAASQQYRVQPKDTVYSIAFRYGLDVDQLAKANKLSPPYHILVGQTLTLLPDAADSTVPVTSPVPISAPMIKSTAVPVVNNPVNNTAKNIAPAAAPVVPTVTTQPVATGPIGKWIWPANGKIIQTYSNAYAGNKGIDIAGKLGDPVKATAAGRVVYCGTGLRGYGLLIIIKHNAKYLSAYAHNSKALVKEGDKVTAGQVIARMGSSDATRVMLHFEIRQSGKPVDPLKLLPPR